MSDLSKSRLQELLATASRARLWVIGDVMLDQFVWGRVSRISPEAPVPIVDFDRENLMPGGAANVARNVTALGGSADLAGVILNSSHAKPTSTSFDQLGRIHFLFFQHGSNQD